MSGLKTVKKVLAGLLIAGFALSASDAKALNRDVRAVFITSTYGLVAGTIVGAAIAPINKDARSIFIGSSVGLYLGIATGVYYILNRDDPENPLNIDEPGRRGQVDLQPEIANLYQAKALPRGEVEFSTTVVSF